MKKTLILLAVLAAGLVANAQNYALQNPVQSVVLTNTETLTLDVSAFRLTAVAGGTSSLAVQTVCDGTSNAVTSIAFDYQLSVDGADSGNWSATTSVTNTVGSAAEVTTLNTVSCGPYRYFKLISVRNPDDADSATISVTLGQHR